MTGGATDDAKASNRRPAVVDTALTLPTGTVVGRFTAPDGRPVGGSVVFTPSTRVLLDGEIVVGAPVVVDLDDQGSLGDGVKLLATDVVGTRPTGFTYRVSFGRLRLSGSGVAFPSIDIAVPGGTVVDLADVAPVTSSGGTAIVIDSTTASRAEAAADSAELSAARAEAAAGEGGSGGQGPEGPPGRDGVDGKDGRDGVDGRPGADGLPGADGADGPPGRDGVDGADGERGLPGADGQRGLPGADGLPGRDGTNGVDGRDGARGLPGADGAAGKDGAAGTNGTNGVKGDTGATGPQGAAGGAVLLPAGATSTPLTTPIGTLVGYRKVVQQ
jgi:hypothetical protein